MIIFEINTNNKEWILEGETDCGEEKDLFLFGENDGLPVVVELKDYIVQSGKKILIKLPVSIFNNIKINQNFSLALCYNFNLKNTIRVEPKIKDFNSKIWGGGKLQFPVSCRSKWYSYIN